MIEVFERRREISVVVGSRLRLAGHQVRRDACRRLLSRCFSLAAAGVLGLPLRDTQCGLKLFRSNAAYRLFSSPFRSRWIFDVEVLGRLVVGEGRAAAASQIYECPLERWTEIPGSRVKLGDFAKAMTDLAGIFAGLGSHVDLIYRQSLPLRGFDEELREALAVAIDARGITQHKGTTITRVRQGAGGERVVTLDDGAEITADLVLFATGRHPNTEGLGLEAAGVRTEHGRVVTDAGQRTSVPHIYAIGDVVGGALLAHKAAREARVAIEVIAGDYSEFTDIIIPAVVFTDPEVAWCGLTEAEAKAKNIPVEVAKFPWSASGRALSFDRTDGLTKLIVDPETERVLGVGICGHGAGELISEGVLAIEMGATVRDIALCIHPHPTLSETIMEAAEVFYGHSTHTFTRKKA